MNRKEVATRIRLALKGAEVSQADLARKMRVSKANISRLLSGRTNITIDNLARIAKALDMRLEIHLF